MGIFAAVLVLFMGQSFAGNDNASIQGDLGQCLADLKTQGLLPNGWQLGPGTLPTTFSEFSKDEGNTILFHTPSASYKINLVGRGSETYSPKPGQTYFEMLAPLIKKSPAPDQLASNCGKVEQLKHLFDRMPAKTPSK